jgi:hypothetical protein
MILMMRILLSLSLTTSVLAHSHVDEIWAPNPSVHYKGWYRSHRTNSPSANSLITGTQTNMTQHPTQTTLQAG